MAYRLKTIEYNKEKYKILLQNENGPCPLLAAANVLLLKKSIALPSNCIKGGVVTIDELTNVLFEKILSNQPTTTVSTSPPVVSETTKNADGAERKATSNVTIEATGDIAGIADDKNQNNVDEFNHNHHHIQEVLQIFPTLQYGMDVNPRFNSGPTGMEYTKELNAFDLLHIELVHGWLLDPTSPHDETILEIIGNSSYNELINHVITGNDAMTALEQNPDRFAPDHDDLQTKATKGSVIRSFLDSSGHQLTQYGLQVLHEYVREGDMKIFFRNNHFNTLTKHSDGHLYLLVTDIGFADLPSVVFERIDVIDGDTEYVTGNFQVPKSMPNTASTAATGEQLLASNPQSQADYQLALQLSQENGQVQQQQLQPQQQSQQQSSTLASTASTWASFLQPAPPKSPPVAAPSQGDGGHLDSDLEKALQASLLDQQNIYEHHLQPQQSMPTAVSQPQQPGTYNGGTTVALPPPASTVDNTTIKPAPTNPPDLLSDGNATLKPPPTQQPQQGQKQTATASHAPVVALGVPATDLSQEDRDMMLALQLQRQEEQERQSTTSALAAGSNDEASMRLAHEMARRDHARHQQRHVTAAAPPPSRQPTALPVGGSGGRRNGGASKDNCIIS
mmetsp:Transcript_8438/g.21044  ORF Transcript_8438/g.21044 Transcript_8438/m.21044 type:complete len:620 (-) Transcript_8438:1293-3152(-)